jgi:hypothetical protein
VASDGQRNMWILAVVKCELSLLGPRLDLRV